MWNYEQLAYRAEKYDRFVDYIFANYCYTNKNEKLSLTKEYLYDIQRFSFILGKMHVYMHDRQDMTQANDMLKCFEKEFDAEYSLRDFKEWMADNP